MGLDRKTPPDFKTIEDITFPWPITISLKDNIPFFILNQGELPIIKLSLIFESGSWYEPQHGIAYFTSKMLLEGTNNKTSQEIAAYIDYYGASLEIVSRLDYCSIELVTLRKHFKPMLELLAEILLFSTFPTTQLTLLQQIKIQEIKIEDEKNSQVAHKRFKEALLGKEHPYGYSLTATDIQAIRAEHLIDYHKKHLFAGCQVLLSGQVNDEQIQDVQNYLSFLPSRQPNMPVHSSGIQLPSKIHISKDGSLQTAICIGKVLFTKKHPDYLAMRIVTELLGGYFGSRLMSNIREEKGYTYHIHASMIPLKKLTYFLINTEAIQECAEQTCKEVYKEIEILQTQEVGSEELTTLRNYMIGTFLASINDPFSIMQRFKEVQLHNLGKEFYQQFYHTLYHITPAKIRELANTYLSLDSLTEVRVG